MPQFTCVPSLLVSMPSLAAPNRYAHLIEADELKKYTETFAAYDRDGGGEVDSLELGVMFRKLGHAVPDEAVFAMLDSVDIDESGTMSLEEFCLLMLRYKRGAAMPAWLRVLFVAEDEGAISEESAQEAVDLRRPAEGDGVPADVARRRLTPELLLGVVDLLPDAENLRALDLSGHGKRLGPFGAEEVARALEHPRCSLTSLSLADDAVGDGGALALARALGRSATLTRLDLASNGIGARGADALLAALDRAAPPPPVPPLGGLRLPPGTCALREINLDGNPGVAPATAERIASALVRLDLPRRVHAQERASERRNAVALDPLALDAEVAREASVLPRPGGRPPKLAPLAPMGIGVADDPPSPVPKTLHGGARDWFAFLHGGAQAAYSSYL